MMSHPEIVRELYAWRQDSDRVMKRTDSFTYELDIPWDPGISSIFSGEDLIYPVACALLELPSTAAEPSQKPDPPPSWL